MKVYIFFFPFSTDEKVNVQTNLKWVKPVMYALLSRRLLYRGFFYVHFLCLFSILDLICFKIMEYQIEHEQLEYKDCYLLQAYFNIRSFMFFSETTESFIW